MRISVLQKFLMAVLLLQFICLFGQEPNTDHLKINHNLPNIIPPNPTVNSLLKFEETPIDYYTGQPNINIPLFNHNVAGVSFSINLKYHTGGLMVDERSGWVGTGWALDGEIFITRTIMDFPDELNQIGTPSLIGIHHNYFNNFDLNEPNFDYSNINFQKFLWYSNVRRESYGGFNDGQNDKQHDLYQANILGQSASFYIKRENNQLSIFFKNNDSNLKITPVFDPVTFVISEFRVLDTNGIEFILSEKENSSNHYSTATIKSTQETNYSESPNFTYISSWKVKFVNKFDTQVANFEYINISENYPSPMNISENHIDEDDYEKFKFYTEMPYGMENAQAYNRSILNSKYTITHTWNEIITKKLKKINFKDNTYFEFSIGNLHPEYRTNDNILSGCILNKIESKNNQNIIKSINFVYETDNNTNRLYLKEINEENGIINKHSFDYNDFLPVAFGSLYKDHWGYYQEPYSDIYPVVFQPQGKFSKTEDVVKGSLKSITYPTGGRKEFLFESNSFFHRGFSVFTDLEFKHLNELNWIPQTIEINTENNNHIDFTVTDDTEAQINLNYLGINNQDPNNNVGVFLDECGNEPLKRLVIYKLQNGIETEYNNFTFCSTNSLIKLFNIEAGQYRLKFDQGTTTSIQGTILRWKNFISSPIKEIKGGGLRIKEVKSIDHVYEEKIIYEYNDLVTNFSSGVIDGFLTNVKKYNKNESFVLAYLEISGVNGYEIKYRFDNLSFNFIDYLNNVYINKHKSSNVGYKNVKISKTGNGYEELIYSTPIDMPSFTEDYTYPFLPLEDKSYLHGNLKSKRAYNESNQILLSKNLFYESTLESIIKQVFTYPMSCAQIQFYNSYQNYLDMNEENTLPNYYYSPNENSIYNNCGNFAPFNYYIYSHKHNKTLLDKIETTEYFYNNGIQTSSQNTVEFDYDISTYLVKEKRNKFMKGGLMEELKEKFYYPTDALPTNYTDTSIVPSLINYNLINTPLINEQYLNNTLLNTSHVYFNNFNNKPLPHVIKTLKNSSINFDDRLIYNSYNDLGMPTQVQQPNGMLISYIYAYNHTLPVAKIENVAYASIPSSRITAIQNATDTVTYSEANVKNALDALRNDPALANAMVSTYIHKPLVGVTSVTDPKGDTQTYEYDSFNRLEFVKDKYGNILSENQYHYRPQN